MNNESNKLKNAFIRSACVVFVVLSFLVNPVSTYAASPTMRLYPPNGYAVLKQDFVIDILLNTNGEDTTMARAVFEFDASKLEVTKAEYGDLYCDYPEDEYTVDNDKGVVMITGFCLDPYYNSGDKEELFARVTFKPLVEGKVDLVFNFETSNDEWNSIVKNTGSPPQNVLSTKPAGGSYEIVSTVPTGKGTTSNTDLPKAGIFDDKFVLIGGGLLLVGFVVLLVSSLGRKKEKKRGMLSTN
ncbi:hypothetical protein JW887_01445 [Candidatus Dojkabacteria bacterium]|nr:hypothetical protein [Candidatus Dojkabacteria bacterium]